jgi:hypothetical protein
MDQKNLGKNGDQDTLDFFDLGADLHIDIESGMISVDGSAKAILNKQKSHHEVQSAYSPKFRQSCRIPYPQAFKSLKTIQGESKVISGSLWEHENVV